MDNIAAVAPLVFQREIHQRGQEPLSGIMCAYARTLVKLLENRGKDENAQGERHGRIEASEAERNQHSAGQDRENDGPEERLLEALHGGLPPGEQRPDAGKQQQEETDGNIDVIEERRSNRYLGPLHPFRKDRETSFPRIPKSRPPAE